LFEDGSLKTQIGKPVERQGRKVTGLNATLSGAQDSRIA
jgi:hypothetical protein